MFQTLIKRLKRTPILYRIVIGNAAIIILSAVIGTYVAHMLTDANALAWHFVIFAFIGVIISLALNYAIIQLSLRPMRELRLIVSDIQAGKADATQLNMIDTDPDIYRLSQAMNSLITQLKTSNQQLRVLSERSINAQEEERKRIARSLHDDTGQSLSTLMINIDRLEKLIPGGDEESIKRLHAIRQIAAESLACLREIIYDLRPAILDDLGLLPAIRWYAQTHLQEAGMHMTLAFPDELPPLPPSLTTTFFRVAQEGVNNIIRHSHAKHVTISMGISQNDVYLRLQDDGQGFIPLQHENGTIEQHHWGLVGIQERIELIGGRMSIQSSPEQGTTLQVIAPLVKAEVFIDG